MWALPVLLGLCDGHILIPWQRTHEPDSSACPEKGEQTGRSAAARVREAKSMFDTSCALKKIAHASLPA